MKTVKPLQLFGFFLPYRLSALERAAFNSGFDCVAKLSGERESVSKCFVACNLMRRSEREAVEDERVKRARIYEA
jgi:hypothetical protein